jgi:hypothetical protein
MMDNFQVLIMTKIQQINNKNFTHEMRVVTIMELYELFLSVEGRLFLKNNHKLRAKLELKTKEFMSEECVKNDMDFINKSNEVIMVISNMNVNIEQV